MSKRIGRVENFWSSVYDIPVVDELLFQLGTAVDVNKVLNDPGTDAGYTGNVVGHFTVHGVRPDSNLAKVLQVIAAYDVYRGGLNNDILTVEAHSGSSTKWVTILYSGTHLGLTCFINGTPEELDEWWEEYKLLRTLDPNDVPDEPDNWWDIQAAEFDDDEWADLAGLPIAGGLH